MKRNCRWRKAPSSRGPLLPEPWSLYLASATHRPSLRQVSHGQEARVTNAVHGSLTPTALQREGRINQIRLDNPTALDRPRRQPCLSLAETPLLTSGPKVLKHLVGESNFCNHIFF
ncbi:hypothetical protein CDAR_412961 [Caerostris darwini]|uniref:Uncharacterized protein n=1 Tax=Caerostris darwini TaxID=1538125 RepID=A0AAV4PK30_9ARAC|nr:hypothetical protein CDAR_412961 [Caerostris darwini]